MVLTGAQERAVATARSERLRTSVVRNSGGCPGRGHGTQNSGKLGNSWQRCESKIANSSWPVTCAGAEDASSTTSGSSRSASATSGGQPGREIDQKRRASSIGASCGRRSVDSSGRTAAWRGARECVRWRRDVVSDAVAVRCLCGRMQRPGQGVTPSGMHHFST